MLSSSPPALSVDPWCGCSQVVHLAKYGPVMIQSSVPIHQGNSGGAMIAAEDGSLVGLVTSNARHISGRIIPTLNFTLPVNMVAEPVTSLIQAEEGGRAEPGGGDGSWARRLGLQDDELSNVWNLEPPPFDITIGNTGLPLPSKL